MTEPVFFTKTCARDWKRCCYQMLAIRRLFPLTRHIVMIEEAEFMPSWPSQDGGALQVDPRRIWKDAGDLSRRVSPLIEAGEIRLAFVERYMPEAMTIENPDLRQQYVKLRAPIVFGVDMIQIDSDMCPKPVQMCWADELYRWQFRSVSRILWDYYECPKQYKDALIQWGETYDWLMAPYRDRRLPEYPSDRDLLFMSSQYGWYIDRDVARGFFILLGSADGGGRERTLREPQRVVDRILECVEHRRLKFSEYQLFGRHCSAMAKHIYKFHQLYEHHTPLSKIGDHSWLLHFTSKEQLTVEQEAQLRAAAGLE